MHLVGLVLCCLTVIQAVPESKETVKQLQTKTSSDNISGKNIEFELPDLTAQKDTEQGEIQLEAFKAKGNDQFIQEKKPDSISKLYWVSIGYPKLLRTRSKHNASMRKIFHFKTDEFYTRVQMMTPEHRNILSETASRKYHLPINSSQIKHLPLLKFECSIELYENDRKYIINGDVRNFGEFPLRMDFRVSAKSRERRLFAAKLEIARSDTTEDITLNCKLASSGKQRLTNMLVISSELSQNLGLADKLFGPVRVVNQTAYVTRNQLTSLSAEMYSALKVVEEYEIPEYQFKEDFVEELVKQVAIGQFQQVSFNQAIKELSTFGVNFGADLKADEIHRDFGKIFKVSSYKNKSHIVVDEEHLKTLRGSEKLSGSVSGSVSYGPFNIGESVALARAKLKEWRGKKKSLNDQLRELNSEKTVDVEWKIEGNEILPKSINAVKISHAKFMQTLSFKRIRHHVYEAPYQKHLRLYTENSISKDNEQQLRYLLEQHEQDRRVIGNLTTAVGKLQEQNKLNEQDRRRLQNLTDAVNELQNMQNRHRFQTLADAISKLEEQNKQLNEDNQRIKNLIDSVRKQNSQLEEMARKTSSCSVNDPNGWISVVNRVSDAHSFERPWANYVKGFADFEGNCWIGLEKLHQLTCCNKTTHLRVDMWDWNSDHTYAEYSQFKVENVSTNYRMTTSGYQGTAGDALLHHNGLEFSTMDRDNDKISRSCSRKCKGGWWYGHSYCYSANPTGIFYDPHTVPNPPADTGILWWNWGKTVNLKNITIKVRALD